MEPIHPINIVSNQFFVPHNVLEEDKFVSMKYSSQILYVHLCKLKNRLQQDKFYRSLKTLAKDTGMSIKTLKQAKKELIKCLYINVERDYYTHNGFRSADVFALNGYKYKS